MTVLVVSLLIPLLVAIVSCLICSFAQQIGSALDLVDHPGSQGHKLHDRPTPLVGGIAIVTPILLVSFLMAALPQDLDLRMVWPNGGWASIGALCALLVMGVWDDRRHLSPWLRLFMASLIYGTLMTVEPRFIIKTLTFPLFGVDIPLEAWGAPFTLFSLLVFQNAVNMADGRNGLVLGLGIFWLLALLSTGHSDFPLVLVTLVASLAVVLVFNLRGCLFLGDSGSYAIATIVGLLAIWLHNVPESGITSSQNFCLMIIPVIDMGRLMLARLRAGRSPFTPDRDHLHHRLDRTLGKTRGLLVYWSIASIPGMIALSNPNFGLLGTFLAATFYGIAIYATRHPTNLGDEEMGSSLAAEGVGG